jgi:amino acid transporter/nucleotide-binding universal stress UspA family protein
MAERTDHRGEGRLGDVVRLSRTLGPFTVTMMGVGGMIGAGIFALTGIAAGEAGPAVILVFVLNGLVTLLTAFAYAELGSAFPRAGGGYVWVKEGLGGASGFLAGWMSWCGYVVAGALYAIAFGGFAAHAWMSSALPAGGFTVSQLGTGFTVLIILVFTAFNFLGAKEAGAMGNLVTLAKIAILGLFVVFGLAVMLRSGAWEHSFIRNFMPNGAAGVFIAMGLTFIAFEGYEIIAQSGEEIIDPKRNIPFGIFISIGIAVAIYLLVGVVAIGATIAPQGMSVHTFLGQQRELAVVSIARQIFPFGIGGVLMLISGLAATMSALNVTIYSASRVSFAMGREHNLPAIFARIHPARLTPYVSVIVTGALMLGASLALPIETAATAGGLMFLLMFIQVNLAMMVLKNTRPEVKRGFNVPYFPLPNLVAITANAALVLYMITYNPVAVWTAFGWIVLGLLAYYMHFEEHEIAEKPKEIVHEETVGEFTYTVLIAAREEREARVLGRFGAAVAKARSGGVVAVHMLEVPPPLSLNEGRRLLDTGRAYFEAVREEGKARKVGLHTLMMIARRVAPALEEIAHERRAGLVVLGFRGKSKRGRTFGRTIDPLLGNPPADLAIVRPADRSKRVIETILVPVDPGPNSRLAVELATDIGPVVAGRKHARITLLRVVKTKTEVEGGSEPLFERLREGIEYLQIDTKVIQGASISNAIIAEATNYDLVIFGASNEPMLKRITAGSIAKRILRGAKPETVMVKRRQPVLYSLLRRTVLPSTWRSR